MFEDIYKKTDPVSKSLISYSISFKEKYWEEIKKNPKKLGDIIRKAINSVLDDSISKNHKAIFTGFEFINKVKNLSFYFELYDMDDKDQRKIYLDKLDPGERKRYEL